MREKLKCHLDSVFSPYENLNAVKELKDELYRDLQEKLDDLKKEGFDEETAYQKTIASIGEISELVESINVKSRNMQQPVRMDFSMSSLKDSDFKGVKVVDGKFNYSDLKGSDFSGADLSNSSFKCSNLENVKFDGTNLTGAKIDKSNLTGATFKDAIFDGTEFDASDLSGISFDHARFNGTSFKHAGLKNTSFRNAVFMNVSFKTDVKKAIFDGATMDKLTYALLKGYKANLDNVTVI